MGKDLIYKDAQGENHKIDLSVTMYREAADQGQSLPQYLATTYPTDAGKYGSSFEQLLEQNNIFVRSDREHGIRASTVRDVMNPVGEAASAITRDGVPASRILFPAVILGLIEDKLTEDLSANVNGFNQLVAVDDSISSDRFERPVLSYSKVEGASSAPVGQLAMPPAMLSITASDKSYRIPTYGIGLEISEQAQKSTTIDLVGLAVARQGAVEANARAMDHILHLLNGDGDMDIQSLAAAGRVVQASTLDAEATGGVLTQKAWMTWLTTNVHRRRIDTVVTDLNGAMAIEGRKNKPVITGDNPNSPRIDTILTVANPLWAPQVKVWITTDSRWPANTVMGIDTRYGVHRVKSLTAEYSAVEAFALKRSTGMRVDSGELVYRLFDEAFEVLTFA